MTGSGAEPAAPRTPAARAAAALSRHASIYGAGIGLQLVLSLAALVLLTRYLTPAEFGTVAIALVAASLLTVLLNGLLLMGAMVRSFRDVDDEDYEPSAKDTLSDEPRRALGTAVVGTAIGGAAAVALACLAWPLGLEGDTPATIVLAAAVGGLGALHRMLTHVLRLQRRPFAYVVVTAARPVLTAACAVPLAADGAGAAGVVAGFAIGTAAAAFLAAVVVRSHFRLALDLSELVWMVKRSLEHLPIIMGFWVIQSADIFVVAAFATASEVGDYRVASRFGALVAYGGSALLMAWGPLRRSVVFRAADDAHGADPMRSGFATYVLLFVCVLALAVALSADALVSLAPAAYASAAELVPVLVLPFVALVVLKVVFRTSSFPGRRRFYRRAIPSAALVFLPLCIGLVALLGRPGAALAAVVVLGAVTAWLIASTRRAERPVAVRAAIVAPAAALAGLLYAAVTLSDAGAPADVAAVLVLAILSALLVPRRHRAVLFESALLVRTQRGPRTIAAYSRILQGLQRRGVDVLPLTDCRPDPGRTVVLLRHDVRGDGAAIREIAEAEEQLGVRSTWCFLVDAVDPLALEELRRAGHRIGLLSDAADKDDLADELRAFADLGGPADVVALQPPLLEQMPPDVLVTAAVPRAGRRDGVEVVVDAAPQPAELPVLLVTLPRHLPRGRRRRPRSIRSVRRASQDPR